MCIECDRQILRAQQGPLQRQHAEYQSGLPFLFGPSMIGAAAMTMSQSQAMAQDRASNPHCAHIQKSKLAEIAANMEKTYMMIPSCGVRDKLEADAEYLKKMAL
jgi:hypothetical protein